MLVLVILTVLSGVAFTSLGGLGTARENLAATRVRATLAFAAEWAMGSGRHTWVDFDVGTDLVSVYVEDPANPGKANRLTMTDPLTRAPMTLQLGDNGVGITAADFDGTTEVHFDGMGTPHDTNGTILAADGTVGVTGGGTVRVTRNTGLVTVD